MSIVQAAQADARFIATKSLAPIAKAPTGEIDITFGFDARYVAHAAAVIGSVVRHAPGGRFRFIILHAGIDAALQKRMESVAPGQRFVWVEVGDDDLPPFADRMHFSRATLFRLGLEKLAPADCHRVLYLDADITVLADVRELYNTDLEGNPVAAAIDAFVDPVRFQGMWKLPTPGTYFNAGILLIDLDMVRREGLFQKAADFVLHNDPELNDQDALNWACWNRWKRVDVDWNAQRHMAIPSLVETELTPDKRLNGRAPKIIHFTGPEKPWLAKGYHPWSWVYWESLQRTPFFAEVVKREKVSTLQRLKLWARFKRRGF
ncbi:MAG TPA: glycosyltransferase family 8 protein [Hyphomonadaceae bacterium]|jgi:lipopolysaccharide biosynthesis glycosyltransferase|nr:glycosyltransferase family 8 protein [Hyphomonadaceae bacterium]